MNLASGQLHCFLNRLNRLKGNAVEFLERKIKEWTLLFASVKLNWFDLIWRKNYC